MGDLENKPESDLPPTLQAPPVTNPPSIPDPLPLPSMRLPYAPTILGHTSDSYPHFPPNDTTLVPPNRPHAPEAPKTAAEVTNPNRIEIKLPHGLSDEDLNALQKSTGCANFKEIRRKLLAIAQRHKWVCKIFLETGFDKIIMHKMPANISQPLDQLALDFIKKLPHTVND